ncbi:MAG: hypothetical protein Q8P88_01495 [Candidatus Jorgensenbacteria bacterium]|nr:hypothetical protein [Candidatus Jorgensenbacteria bacterium]
MKPLYKILLIILAVILLAASAYFVWWLFLEEPTPEVPGASSTLPGGTTSRPNSTSTTPNSGISISSPRAISDHTAFDYWLVPETGEVYYLTPEGHVYAVKEGPDLEISRQTITALNRVEPSPDGRRLLVSFGNPTAPQWVLFDTVDSVWRPLPSQITNAGWGRTSSELIASVTSGNDMNLSFVDITKTPPIYTVLVRNFRMEDVIFSTLDGGDVLITERASANFEGRVWRINPDSRVLTLALAGTKGRTVKIVKGENVSYLGSTDGFSIADRTLQNASLLFFNTLPDKCAAAASTTYCFAPRNLGTNTSIPDDYFMRKFYSVDSLYSIAHPSGALRALIFGEGTFDASRVRAEKNAVYFLDRYTNKLYELKL